MRILLYILVNSGNWKSFNFNRQTVLMKKISIYFVSILCVLLGSCSSNNNHLSNEALAELNFDKLSYDIPYYKETTLNLERGQKIEFWSCLDIEFEGDIEMAYLVELWEKNKKIGGFELNALKTNPTLFKTEKQLGSKSVISFEGKMDFLNIDHSGNYTFKVILYCSNTEVKCKMAKLKFK